MATREDFVRLFDSAADAADFEVQVLSIGAALLPPCAIAVRDRTGEPSAEYWDWLVEQAEELR